MDDVILDLEEAAMERWRRGDPMGFLELSAEDICYVDPGQARPIIGQADYRQYMEGLVGKVHYDRSEFIDPRVVQVGNAALLTYNYRSSVLSPDGQVASQTPWNSTEVYFLRRGEWRIVHNHWSYIHHRLTGNVEVPVPVPSEPVHYSGVLGELMRLESAAMERWRKGDPWGFVEIYAPGVTYFDTGTSQRLNGREELIAEYKLRQGKIYYDVMEFIDPWVVIEGDMAVLFYRFFSTRLNPDGSIAQRVPWNSTEVYQRMEGSWRIIHNHWSHIHGERS
ncbi:MAG: YybH family protein [Acidobacteriaceae bacterium]